MLVWLREEAGDRQGLVGWERLGEGVEQEGTE